MWYLLNNSQCSANICWLGNSCVFLPLLVINMLCIFRAISFEFVQVFQWKWVVNRFCWVLLHVLLKSNNLSYLNIQQLLNINVKDFIKASITRTCAVFYECPTFFYEFSKGHYSTPKSWLFKGLYWVEYSKYQYIILNSKRSNQQNSQKFNLNFRRELHCFHIIKFEYKFAKLYK